jgi:hypothetical protein
MKIGQLVMLIKREVHPLFDIIHGRGFPPIGASGEVVAHCGMTASDGEAGLHVHFPNFPCKQDGDWWHVPISWLIKIDDPDAVKADEDQHDLDIGNGEKLKEADLAKMGRRMLEDLEREDA